MPYLCKTHWHSFEVINLEENHRQGNDHTYAEILNRIRVGEHTEDDMNVLRTRVRPEGHMDLVGAMYVTCTNKTVLKMNNIRLNELKSELHEIEARNIHPTIKDFKPRIDEKGTVGGTAFLQSLKVKIGARVMLIHNIDVLDGLSNRTRGILIAIEKNAKNQIQHMIIKFDEDYQGENKRRKNPGLSRKYPGCTPIERYLCSYSLTKKSTVASNTAQVYQFPVVVCFAATTHKIQGGTIQKPMKLAVDLRTVFDDAMAYVMLSRVQDIIQLYIDGALPEAKFKTSMKCLEELSRLLSISVNNNPQPWEQRKHSSVKVSVLNCHSLQDKISHIRSDKIMMFSDLICLTETWVKEDTTPDKFPIEGYSLHLNGVREWKGKGVAVYYKSEKFMVKDVVKLHNLQITQMASSELDVIVVYRSADCKMKTAIDMVWGLVDLTKSVIVCGDINLCFSTFPDNSLVRSFTSQGFDQLVKEATHINGGLIDHVYFKSGRHDLKANVSVYSPYYTAHDHDAMLVEVSMEEMKN